MKDVGTTPSAAAQLARSAACPGCLHVGAVMWGHRSGHALLRCKACGLVYFERSTLPGNDYQAYHSYMRDWTEEDARYELSIREAKYERQLEEWSALSTGRRLLDIGAGPGYLCRTATTRGWHASGCELSDEAAQFGRSHFGVRYVSLDSVADRSCDVVVLHHVLEHVVDPRAFLVRIWRMLDDRGILAVKVPLVEPFSFWLRNHLRRRSGDKLCSLYLPDHLSGFSPRSMRRIAEACGFRLIRERRVFMWMTDYDPFFLARRLKAGGWGQVAWNGLRHVIDYCGLAFGRWDWLVAVLRKDCGATRPDTNSVKDVAFGIHEAVDAAPAPVFAGVIH